MQQKIAVCVVCATAVFGTPLRADILILRNGNTVEGTMVGQTKSEVLMLVRGKRVSYAKRDVRSIRYSESSEETNQGRKQQEMAAGLRRRAEELKKARDLVKIRAELEKQRSELDGLLKEIEGVFQKQEARRKLTSALNAELDRRDRLARESEADWPYVWRSMLLPGWGQFRNGDTGWGIFFSSTIGVLALATFQARERYAVAKAAYTDQNMPVALTHTFVGTLEPTSRSANTAMLGNILLMDLYGSLRGREMEKQKRTVNVLGSAILLIHIWNVLHALVSVRPLPPAPGGAQAGTTFFVSWNPDAPVFARTARTGPDGIIFGARISF